MKRSRLWNNLLKNRVRENKTLYTKQRNYCISLLKKSKNKYFRNLNEKDILNNKPFWKKITALLSNKVMTTDRINLSEKVESLKIDLEKAEVLNKFFSNIANNLEISKYPKYVSFIDNNKDQSYIKACSSKYPSFLKILSQNTNVDLGKATAHKNVS